jgi:hypothetical protein
VSAYPFVASIPLKRPLLMPDKETQVTCTQCLKRFTAVPKISFCGFQKFRCPHCRKTVFYPLVRKTLYWIIPTVVSALLFFIILSFLDLEWGDQLLLSFAALPIGIDEKKSLILWPLLLWSLVRLGGMYSNKVLDVSRKILYGAGITVFLFIILAFFGFVAGAVRVGINLPPFIGALLLLCFFIFIWVRNVSIRKNTKDFIR